MQEVFLQQAAELPLTCSCLHLLLVAERIYVLLAGLTGASENFDLNSVWTRLQGKKFGSVQKETSGLQQPMPSMICFTTYVFGSLQYLSQEHQVALRS